MMIDGRFMVLEKSQTDEQSKAKKINAFREPLLGNININLAMSNVYEICFIVVTMFLFFLQSKKSMYVSWKIELSLIFLGLGKYKQVWDVY